MRRSFQEATAKEAERIAVETKNTGTSIVTGAPWVVDGSLFNAALVISGGAIQQVCLKSKLPNYGVFDEKRLFKKGAPSKLISINVVKIGILLCEDIWTSKPSYFMAQEGAEILVVINGSPFDVDKVASRQCIPVETGVRTSWSKAVKWINRKR